MAPSCGPGQGLRPGSAARGAAPGRIAFVANYTQAGPDIAPGDVYTVNPDGSSLARLTRTSDTASPSWSPDGQKLAYVRIDWKHDSATGLWIMNADGSGQRHVLDLGSVGSPDWSPDGNRIALGLAHGIGVLDLRTEQLSRFDWSVPHWYAPTAARWSATGSQLAVVAQKKGPGPDDYTATTALFIGDTSGRDVRQVAGTKDLLGFDWSWANCDLLYGSGLATRGGECNGDLFATDPENSAPRLVVELACRQEAPAWSPDGSAMVFVTQEGLWVADQDGGNPHEIVHRAGPDGDFRAPYAPDWQPAS